MIRVISRQIPIRSPYRRPRLVPVLAATGAILLSACGGSAPLGVTEVAGGGDRVTLRSPADCTDWESCQAPVLTVRSGDPVRSGLTNDSAFAVVSIPDADWGIEADASGRRITTTGLAPGRYVVTITTSSGMSQFRLEVTS